MQYSVIWVVYLNLVKPIQNYLSQSVQIGSTQSEPQAVGCDGGKKVKGRKRHILVDTWGLLKGYEIVTDTSEAFLYIAMIRLSLRRLA
jgi:hypothetical protein